MELLQNLAPAEGELLGTSAVRTLDIRSLDIKDWISDFSQYWTLDLRH